MSESRKAPLEPRTFAQLRAFLPMRAESRKLSKQVFVPDA